MGASKFVGRVGGLAIALGVGAALSSGAAVAWADSPSSGSSSTHGSASSSASTSEAGTGSGRSSGSTRSAARGGGKATQASRTGLTRPTSTVRAQSIDTDDTLTEVIDSPATSSAATAPAPGSGELPGAPVDLLVESTLLAYSRRETPVSTLPTPIAASTASAVVLPGDGENIALIMGGSGTPIPSATYIAKAFAKYVQQNSPEGTIPEQLVTPEGLYPITPYPYVKVLPLSISVDQGNQILYDEILQQIEAGNTLTVFGYSQSAIISSLVMDPENAGCVNTPTCGIDPDTPVNFVLIGNEMNPNGGFLSRFPGLNLPSLGIPFYGATPEDSFPVANYMLEYDGFADFPQYPINFLADLNAALGIAFVHGTYLELTPEQIASAIELPTSTPTQKYFVIPTENLPLVEPIRLIPFIGDPIADLLQPALRVLVNLGYGDPKYGWSQGTANVVTPFGFIPDVDWGETVQLLVDGVVQGIQDFWADIKPGGSMWQEMSAHVSHVSASVSAGLASLHALAADGIIPVIQNAVNNVAQFVSNAAASLYATLLPTADIVNAIVTMLPAYGIDLFLDGIQQILSGDIIGGLLNAVGLPWAAGVGLVTTSALIELLVIANGVTGIFTLE